MSTQLQLGLGQRMRRLVGAALLFALAFAGANQGVSLAASSASKGRVEAFWDQGVYYCLANRDLVKHTHNSFGPYGNEMDVWTRGQTRGSCFTPAYPASVRSQLVGWYQHPTSGNQVCFATDLTPWIDATPSSPAVARIRVDLTDWLPCGNNRPYAVGGNHQGLWWPGGIDSNPYISPMQTLHWPVT